MFSNSSFAEWTELVSTDAEKFLILFLIDTLREEENTKF